ncbi:hypothetical protein BASA62_000404 [Batrachochytrium salamandrivorans]|nr:hypothetical protein BASA62_000404 [Batrachochytrium salamandrivorans]
MGIGTVEQQQSEQGHSTSLIEQSEQSEQVLSVEQSEHMLSVEQSEQMLLVEQSEQMLSVEQSEQMLSVEQSEHMLSVEQSEQMLLVEQSEQMLSVEQSEQMLSVEQNKPTRSTKLSKESQLLSKDSQQPLKESQQPLKDLQLPCCIQLDKQLHEQCQHTSTPLLQPPPPPLPLGSLELQRPLELSLQPLATASTSSFTSSELDTLLLLLERLDSFVYPTDTPFKKHILPSGIRSRLFAALMHEEPQWPHSRASTEQRLGLLHRQTTPAYKYTSSEVDPDSPSLKAAEHPNRRRLSFTSAIKDTSPIHVDTYSRPDSDNHDPFASTPENKPFLSRLQAAMHDSSDDDDRVVYQPNRHQQRQQPQQRLVELSRPIARYPRLTNHSMCVDALGSSDGGDGGGSGLSLRVAASDQDSDDSHGAGIRSLVGESRSAVSSISPAKRSSDADVDTTAPTSHSDTTKRTKMTLPGSCSSTCVQDHCCRRVATDVGLNDNLDIILADRDGLTDPLAVHGLESADCGGIRLSCSPAAMNRSTLLASGIATGVVEAGNATAPSSLTTKVSSVGTDLGHEGATVVCPMALNVPDGTVGSSSSAIKTSTSGTPDVAKASQLSSQSPPWTRMRPERRNASRGGRARGAIVSVKLGGQQISNGGSGSRSNNRQSGRPRRSYGSGHSGSVGKKERLVDKSLAESASIDMDVQIRQSTRPRRQRTGAARAAGVSPQEVMDDTDRTHEDEELPAQVPVHRKPSERIAAQRSRANKVIAPSESVVAATAAVSTASKLKTSKKQRERKSTHIALASPPPDLHESTGSAHHSDSLSRRRTPRQ